MTTLKYTSLTIVYNCIIEGGVRAFARVTILPSVKISKGVVKGVGAIVNKDIPEYAIAVGVPAKVVSFRS